MSKKVKDLLIFILIIALGVALELSIGGHIVRDENLFLIFILGILIILIETQKITYGILASIIFVLTFNFFCTTPLYQLRVDDINYYVSFVIFIIISLIIGSLVVKLQRQITQSKQNEKRIQTMYEFSKKFLTTQSEKDIYEVVLKYLSSYLNREFYAYSESKVHYGKELNYDATLLEAISVASKKNILVGAYQMRYSSLDYIIFPLKSKVSSFGCILVSKGDSFLSEEEVNFIENILYELIVVLERESITRKQELSEAQIQKEKIKNTILRSLSHDLKTPLTSIQSGSSFLYENFDSVNDEEKKELLKGIYNESLDLSNFVYNLLNLSRLESNSVVEKSYEALEDIIATVKERINKIDEEKRIIYPQDYETSFIYCNGQLLTQVLYNLLDNALKYALDGNIYLEVKNDNKYVTFIVRDEGEGIKEEKLNYLFNDFYTIMSKKDHKRSTGLGLSICKSIVAAHNGEIKAYNNKDKGATFAFTILNERG